MAIKENDKVAKAEEILKAILADDELQEELRIREKHRMDYNNGMMYAMEKGRKKGREEGIEEGEEKREREIAKNLLTMKLSMSQIQQTTGLTKKEIEKLAHVSSQLLRKTKT